jgi:hypothetical protein
MCFGAILVGSAVYGSDCWRVYSRRPQICSHIFFAELVCACSGHEYRGCDQHNGKWPPLLMSKDISHSALAGFNLRG